MDYASLVIWTIALALLVKAYFRKDRSFRQGLEIAGQQTYAILPKIVLAITVSGFFTQIAPTELVAAWLGKDSGLKGVMIGSLVGGFTPGGPIICFPIVYILLKSGAAVPALVALLTAWSVFAFHRVLAYEIPLLGARFVAVKFAACLAMPPAAGLMAMAIMNAFNIQI